MLGPHCGECVCVLSPWRVWHKSSSLQSCPLRTWCGDASGLAGVPRCDRPLISECGKGIKLIGRVSTVVEAIWAIKDAQGHSVENLFKPN
eukprot:1010954-Amphidinium_carterae.1